VDPSVAQALHGLKAGDEIIVITWLHKGRRDVLKVHLRSKKNRALTGDSQRDLLTARTRWAFTR
jgi:tRNA (Thr-GGU) A37 N-methylase